MPGHLLAAPRVNPSSKGSFASLSVAANRINQRAGTASPPRRTRPADPRDALLADVRGGAVALRPTRAARTAAQGPIISEHDKLLMSVSRFDKTQLRPAPRQERACNPHDALLSQIKRFSRERGEGQPRLRHVEAPAAPRPPSPRSQLLAQVRHVATSGSLRRVEKSQRPDIGDATARRPLVNPHECMMMQIRKFQPSNLSSASSTLRRAHSPEPDLHTAFKDALSERFRGCRSPGQHSDADLNDTAAFEDTALNDSWYDPVSP